ncbi:MAG: type VI secretion system baseplate subunit TssG [Gammaproteobacteria bacterium]
MASKNGQQRNDIDLLSGLQQNPYQYGFYSALRQLECLYKDKPRIGYARKPSDDAVRYGQEPSMKFASSTLASFGAKNGAVAKLKVLFFGVFGVNGPLPLHLTEFARSRTRHSKDDTLTEFTDLFHHRLLTLFYRAWADKEPTVQHDRKDKDRFAFYIATLLGIGEISQQKRDVIPDHTKLHFAAHLGCHTGHASGLQAMLIDYLQVKVNIEEFIGEWLDMPTDSLCYLNDDITTGQLGVSTIIGSRSWQCQHKFRIVLGPLDREDYDSLLPTGDKLESLRGLVKNYMGIEYDWEINLILKKEQVPTAQLGKFARLGWTSWSEAADRDSDANDLTLAMG